MNNKIVDCFIFYNELEMLKYRLSVLDNMIDYFVIVESKYTFSGKEKELYYNNNKDLFKQWLPKIIHVIIQDAKFIYPNIDYDKKEQWLNEKYQRNNIHKGIEYLKLNDNDLIIISDLDEIPDIDRLKELKFTTIDIRCFEQDFYYYNLNSKVREKWYLSKILSYSYYKKIKLSCDEIRKLSAPIIKKGGWHLSYFGNELFIKNKIENFSHQELNNEENTNTNKIKYKINNQLDIFSRNDHIIDNIELADNNYLPYFIIEFINLFYNVL